MKRWSSCWSLVLGLAAGCGPTSVKVTVPSSVTMNGSGGGTGATTLGIGATTSSGAAGPAASTNGSAASTTAGTTATTANGNGSTTATVTGATGASGSTSSSCVANGVYPGTGGAALCCSGAVDSNGYCAASATGSTGTTATTATTATTTTTTTSTTSSGGGFFGGGWVPPDAGYQPAPTGDGGTLVLVDPSAPSNPSSMFGGSPDPNASPTIVYPPDGVLMPPNVDALEIQFVPAAGQTVFQITFNGPGQSLIVYTGCNQVGSGCEYKTDATDFWGSLVNYARGGPPVSFSIAGVNGSSPGSVGTSATQSISFSDQNLTAGVYYWNTEGAIERFDWGYPTVAPEAWISPATPGVAAVCVGCHALSRQGDLAAVAANIPEPAAFGIWQVATTTPWEVNGNPVQSVGNFFSFSPDGTLLLQSDGESIYMMDVDLGVAYPTPLVASGTMPDWSPSGDDMVFAQPAPGGFPFPSPTAISASLQRAPYMGFEPYADGGYSGGFGASTTLVPFQGANNYYPAIDPTGTWVAYNVSPHDNDSFSNADPPGDGGSPDGELWVVGLNGGTSIRLSTASNPGPLSWPKWAPVVSNYNGGQVEWITFASQRAYGLELSEYQVTQLWMVGFDPVKAASGQDGSFPAFYLPFQDPTSGNHIAQWVTSIVRPPCTSSSQCPSGQICKDGRCAPNVTNRPSPHALGGAKALLRRTGASAENDALLRDWLKK